MFGSSQTDILRKVLEKRGWRVGETRSQAASVGASSPLYPADHAVDAYSANTIGTGPALASRVSAMRDPPR